MYILSFFPKIIMTVYKYPAIYLYIFCAKCIIKKKKTKNPEKGSLKFKSVNKTTES